MKNVTHHILLFVLMSSCFFYCTSDQNSKVHPEKENMSSKVELPKCVSRKLVQTFGTFYSVIHNFCEVVKPEDVVVEIESSKSIMDNKMSYGFSISIFSKNRYNAFIPENQYQAHILRTASESTTVKDYDIDPLYQRARTYIIASGSINWMLQRLKVKKPCKIL